MKEKYPWLEQDNKRRNILDREILEKYIDLDKYCLLDTEKKQVMYMLYKYKDAFSLRDEIGSCPNIEVELDITEKSTFLLDHIMLRKKVKLFWIKNEKIVGILWNRTSGCIEDKLSTTAVVFFRSEHAQMHAGKCERC